MCGRIKLPLTTLSFIIITRQATGDPKFPEQVTFFESRLRGLPVAFDGAEQHAKDSVSHDQFS